MTREEAIERLVDLRVQFQAALFTREAIDMAIEALQTPPISQRSMYQLGYKQGQEDSIQTDIVRCGECKYRDPENKHCDCGAIERQGCKFPTNDEYFCSYGERKE